MENVKYIPGDLMEHITTGKICKLINISIDRDYIIEECDTHTRICTDIGRLSSIPLTPQILEANGWKPDGEWLRFRTGKAYIYICESSSQRGTYLVCVGDNKYFIACISYIHQLQHLLFGLGLDSSLKV